MRFQTIPKPRTPLSSNSAQLNHTDKKKEEKHHSRSTLSIQLSQTKQPGHPNPHLKTTKNGFSPNLRSGHNSTGLSITPKLTNRQTTSSPHLLAGHRLCASHTALHSTSVPSAFFHNSQTSCAGKALGTPLLASASACAAASNARAKFATRTAHLSSPAQKGRIGPVRREGWELAPGQRGVREYLGLLGGWARHS